MRLSTTPALLLAAFSLALGFSPYASSQNTPTTDTRELVAGAQAGSQPKEASVSLPPGNDAWVLRIIRTGGFTGGPILDVSITSEGTLSCVPASATCGRSLARETLQSLHTLIYPNTISGGQSLISDVCHDCIVTSITIRRREPGGKERTYFGYWDEGTAGKASPELVQISRAALAVKR